MFEEARLLGGAPTKLLLQTRLARNVDNEIALEPSARKIGIYNKNRQKHPNWRHRKNACGRYNCFGHVFANRRTAIYEEEEVRKILADDGYRPVPLNQAMAGDLVVYKASHGIAHVGEVLRVDHPHQLPLVEVLSKWDDSSGEDLHVIHDVCCDYDQFEIITDRLL